MLAQKLSTSRPSASVTWAPCAEAITRSGLQRPASRDLVELALELLAHSLEHHCSQFEDDLAALAAGGDREGLLEVAVGEAVRDHRRDVEARLEHHRHLVPGLVHLAAVDALDREHVEDHAFQSIAISSAGIPSMAMRPPCAMLASMSWSAAGLPDISSPTSKPSVMPSSRCTSATVPWLTSSACVTPMLPRQLEPVGVDVGDDDVARARVADDGGRHDPDRPGAGDQHVLAEHGERERGVDGVAEGIEDRRDVEVDARRVLPDVRHRQRDVLGERAGAVDADALGVRAQMAPPGHAVAAAAADEVPFAADDVARR